MRQGNSTRAAPTGGNMKLGNLAVLAALAQEPAALSA